MAENSAAPVVVGVDGSDSSKAALRWAYEQANLTKSPLRAVIAWEFPSFYGWAAPVNDDFDFAANARNVLEQTIKEVIGEPVPDSVSLLVIEGNAAQALVESAKDAGLLVVGSRGHGGFSGALLGSVSQHAVHHAPCPVVVIRGKDQQ